jgi:hypothetical protein
MRDPSGINEKRGHAAIPVVETKSKTPAPEPPADVDVSTPLPFTQESNVLVEKMYSDDKSKLKSIS